jgi:protein-S-isoprenylcysteine O-methyltransferase Ste14
MRDNPLFVLVRGIVLVTIFIAAWIGLVIFAKGFDSQIGITLPVALRTAGWILALVGGALGLYCVALFLTIGRGTPAPFDPPQVFVATGPYRYVRNPMYVGGLAALLGVGLILSSISILILGGLFWLLAHVMVVLNEEPGLRKRFGESFVQYTQQVNRWLPRLPRSDGRSG